jgi:hypothetical protein
MMTPVRFPFFLLLLGAGVPTAAALAQAPVRGSVAGTVVMATTGLPLAGASVTLEPASGDAALLVPTGGGYVARGLAVVTGADGGYRFANLPSGHYRLTVRHLGYRPAAVDVALGTEAALRVSVALIVTPIRLEPMDVTAITSAPYARGSGTDAEIEAARIEALRYRDERFLSGDAAVLTHGDVVESVTLGETDLFRALQRLPGVSTRDDFTASLWTRGAPWSQTRVTLDGLPLFNPVHAIGVFAAVNPDAVGAAAYLPGVRPASMGEGGAGVLAIATRRAGGAGLRGLGELSVVSGRLAADWGSADGRVGLMVAARRSYVDLATRVAQWFGGDSASYIPYAFHDVAARLDADLGGGVVLEASALTAEDGVRGSVPDLLRRTRGAWGNRVGRVTLSLPAGRFAFRATAGLSRFKGSLNPFDTTGLSAEAPMHGATDNSLMVTLGRLEVSPAGGDPRRSWSAGAEVQHQRQRFAGQYPRPYPVEVIDQQLTLAEQLEVLALWGERRWALGRDVTLETGVRAEIREPMRNAGAVGIAPRLAARYRPGNGRVTLFTAAGRSWQYAQALAPAGPSVGPDLYLTDVWLLANDTIPALRSDVATGGVELWLGAAWIAALNGFVRRSTGMVVPEPAPGRLDTSRAIQVAAVNEAGGLELSLRRLSGRWTGSASYTFGNSMIAARGYRYPSSAHRRHAFDATAMVSLWRGVRVGAAVSLASGAPFSRFYLGCGDSLLSACTDTSALSIEFPNARRTASYAATDLLLDWTRAAPGGGVRLGAFVQLRNVWNAANAVTYTGTVMQCPQPKPPTLVPAEGSTWGGCDRFHRGVGLLPLAGLRVSF